jgi:hypothetical protein
VSLHLPGGQALGDQRDHQVIHAPHAALPLGHDLRGKRGVPVPGHLHLDRARLGEHGLGPVPVAGVPAVTAGRSDLTLPVLDLLPDGSCRSVLISPKITGKARELLTGAAHAGKDLDAGKARYVRVIEYQVPGRDGDGRADRAGHHDHRSAAGPGGRPSGHVPRALGT